MTPHQAKIITESNTQYLNTQSQFNIKCDHRLVGWSGCCDLSACCGARSDVNDWRTEYGETGSFEKHENESKDMILKNSNDMKRT
jgi:hypothetical protein